MSMNNEKRRIGRLPLYVAMFAALPLSGMASSSFAAETSAETTCSADAADGECAANTSTSAGYRASSMPASSPIGVMGGGFSDGSGVSIAAGGETSYADGADIAIGNGAYAGGAAGGTGSGAATALGAGANARGEGTLALGSNASATGTNSVALGADSVATANNTVSVGNVTLQRQITYVAAGVNATDAVNVSQLLPVVATIGGDIDSTTGEVTMPSFMVGGTSYDTIGDAIGQLDAANTANTTNITNLQTQIDNGTIGLVQQAAAGAPITVAAGKDGTVVDFANNAGATRTLTGVSAGTLSASSTEAVNGAQLFATNANVTTNTNDITNLTTQIDGLSSGAAGLVQQDSISRNITVAAATGGTVVDFTGTEGARKVTGVANGDLTETSGDAVNGAQLNDTNQQVSALDGRVSTAEGDITNIKETLAGLGSDLAGGITYDDATTKSQVTLGGAAGTVVTNVAAGAVASGSMDAINGGQLSAIQDNLQSQIGGINDRMNDIADGIGNVGNFDGNLEGQRITNLAPGVADTDAANLGQVKEAASNAVSTANAYTDSKFNVLNNDLQNFKGEVNDRFNRMNQRIDRIGAMSAANTQMAIGAGNVQVGEGRIAAGVGFQNSRTALAVGYAQGVSERVRVSLGAAFSGSESNYGAGVGVSVFKK